LSDLGDIGDEVITLAGNDRAGFKDGVGNEAQFNDPRALAWYDDCIYVADYFNKGTKPFSISHSFCSL
jgi:hypothetical protein